MRDYLAFAGVLCAVACVEEASSDRDESVIVVPVRVHLVSGWAVMVIMETYALRKPLPCP